MKKIILLTFAFCASLLLAINTSITPNDGNKEIKPLQSERELDSNQDEPLQFFKFHEGIRTATNESSPSYSAGYKLDEFRQAYQLSLQKSKNSNIARTQGANGVLEFKERGPGNVPGRTRALLVLPSDASKNTWLAGAATGGIWKTTNGGSTWAEKSANFPVLPISSLAMSSSNNNIIYAGTGELISSIYSAIGDGIFKSLDEGETWTQLPATAGNGDFSIVTRIIVDPQDPNILLASCSRSSLGTDTRSSIMKSTNGGATWAKVYETNNDIEQIVFEPNNFNIQYAAVNSTGVIKSLNAGATWALSKNGMSPSGRLEIAISPVDPNRLFASSVGSISSLSKTGSDLYITDDAGANWNLVDVTINNAAVDFLGGQGFYDNTIACDPFDKNIIYVGGVSQFRVALGSGSSTADNYSIAQNATGSFLVLNAFSNATFFEGGRLQVGASANKLKIEIRFGPGRTQKAHRFFVPDKRTSGVQVNEYTYQNFTDVPFEAWDVSTVPARQLTVSFRDQNRNGFDLVPVVLTATDPSTTLQSAFLDSREYVYIHNITYAATANSTLSVNGGQEVQLAYAFFPALAANTTWSPFSLPNSSLVIDYAGITKKNATTVTVVDSRSQFDGKNTGNQVNQTIGVHADHHFTVIVPQNLATKTYQILLTTDGGVFASNISTTPGIVQGDWQFKGFGFNTSQFYGADKKPGAQEYIGGMQDNGTRKSPAGQNANAQTNYAYSLGGDGFEVSWHSIDGNKVIGSLYNNRFLRSLNGGTTWTTAFAGFPLDASGVPDPLKYPFVSKIGSSRDLPDDLYAVGTDGVWKSSNFGESWTLTPITQSWGSNTTFFDVEVSRANANIVWAGNGMDNTRKLHVSTNGGKTFSPTVNYATTSLGTLTKLASHPTEPNTAFALFSFANRPKILRTKNLGQTWQDISGFGSGSSSTNGFPDVAVYCVYIRPDDINIIWAGTEIGIVESLDGGATWSLLNDNSFPNVSVWDMKGQDDEIVIATHGRGIWTAKLPASQGAILKNPVIQKVGTAPDSKFLIQYETKQFFDSVVFFINSARAGKANQRNAGEYIFKANKLSTSSVTVKLIAYSGASPTQSAIFTGTNLILKPTFERQYSTVFTSISDFLPIGVSLQGFGSSNQSLQSPHNYVANTESSATLLQPIIVSASNSNFFYQDVALVQPSATGVSFGQPGFKDFVVVEGTKDGLNWIPLKDGYNASANAQWLAAYNANQTGTPSLSVDQNIDLKSKFKATDTLLFRFRLKADADATTGWGWSIDNLFIQQPPTGVELSEPIRDLTIFPNPTGGKSKIQFTLIEDTQITIETLDAKGNSIGSQLFERLPAGNHEQNIDLTEQATGLYYVRMKSNKKSTTVKLIKKAYY